MAYIHDILISIIIFNSFQPQLVISTVHKRTAKFQDGINILSCCHLQLNLSVCQGQIANQGLWLAKGMLMRYLRREIVKHHHLMMANKDIDAINGYTSDLIWRHSNERRSLMIKECWTSKSGAIVHSLTHLAIKLRKSARITLGMLGKRYGFRISQISERLGRTSCPVHLPSSTLHIVLQCSVYEHCLFRVHFRSCRRDSSVFWGRTPDMSCIRKSNFFVKPTLVSFVSQR